MSSIIRNLSLTVSVAVLAACTEASLDAPKTGTSPKAETALEINYEKFTLDNGLDVIFHIDRSDPVVAIDLAAHVGSGRETPGRTGFAHLFEHLLFLDSENLGYGGLDEMNTRIGGEGTNGFTTNDMTQYYQAVPKDALEKIIWAEADKLGWFINTVSQDVVDNEKQVVKNEKRQRVDNQPYGHNLYIVSKALYPEDHPYNWQVIGSLSDLDAATLQDVKDFYAKWYVPNNVTVTISGDFDKAVAKAMVEKYFGEIPRGEDIAPYEVQPGKLTESLNFYHEDNFATVPQLSITWPAVEQYHPDSYALDMLLSYLTEGKRAPLNEVMIDEDKVTSDVSAFNYTKEIAGELYLFASPNEGEDIDGLIPSMTKGFARFEENGISQDDLDRIKAGVEVGFYGDVQSALGKAIELGEYNVYKDDPGFYKKDIARIKAVSTDDIMRVYNKYIKDQHAIYVSFVPKGELDLKMDNYHTPVKANVVEEKIVEGEGAAPDFDPAARVLTETTPSAFDRKTEPGFGAGYDLPSAEIWRDTFDNGLQVFGMQSNETPLINFSLRLDAGRQYGSVNKPGIPALTADMLEKGTANKTTAELEDAINSLGSSISITNGDTGSYITVTTLKRNFDETVGLVMEMLNEPRWDAEEFELLKSKTLQDITYSEGDPNSIASRENMKLKYPDDNIYQYTNYGPKERLEDVTLEDLKAFHGNFFELSSAKLRIVGDYSPGDVKAQFGQGPAVRRDGVRPALPGPAKPITESKLYFYDVPGAKQSILRIERPSLKAADDDYPLAEAINFPLGGIYTSKLNTTLRVEKGYTYGIRSGFTGREDRGTFGIRSSVRSNVTKESIELIRDIVGNYGEDFTQEELDIMKGALLRGQALKSETLRDKQGMLNEMSGYGYADDFRAQNAKAIEAMTLADFKALAAKYLRPDAMNYLVVGDAESQAEGLKGLGYGDPIMLNADK